MVWQNSAIVSGVSGYENIDTFLGKFIINEHCIILQKKTNLIIESK